MIDFFKNFDKPAVNLLKDQKLQSQFLSAVSSYLRAGVYDDAGIPLEYEEGKKYLQAKLQASHPAQNAPDFMTRPNTPKVVRINDLLPEVDDRYLKIFKVVKSDSEAEIYYKVQSGITFKKIVLGEEVEFNAFLTGEEITVPNIEYAAGVNIPITWLKDSKYWKINQAIQDAKIAALEHKASFVYGLLASQNYPSAAVDTTNTDTFIDSLNKAHTKLRRQAKRDLVGRKVFIITPPEKRPLFEKAVIQTQLARENANKLLFGFEIIDTVYMKPTDKPVMVLAKTDQYLQEREPLKAESFKELSTLEVRIVFTERFNGVILSNNYGLKLNM